MFRSHQGSMTFPAGRDEVFQACMKAVSQCGFRIARSNPESGQIEARAGMGLLSWGENITITVSTEGRVDIKSSFPKIQVIDYGKTGRTLTHCFPRLGCFCRISLSSNRRRAWTPKHGPGTHHHIVTASTPSIR
jgi:hypothetical protein